MAKTDDVVAVVVHGKPGQDWDGYAGGGRQQGKPVLVSSLLNICTTFSTEAGYRRIQQALNSTVRYRTVLKEGQSFLFFIFTHAECIRYH